MPLCLSNTCSYLYRNTSEITPLETVQVATMPKVACI
jgi:hypothetical protein